MFPQDALLVFLCLFLRHVVEKCPGSRHNEQAFLDALLSRGLKIILKILEDGNNSRSWEDGALTSSPILH